MGAITIKKPAKQALPETLLSDLTVEIDSVGKLLEEAEPIAAQIKALQEKLKPLTKAQKDLQAKIDALEGIGDDEEGHVENGVVYFAEIGKRGTSREIKDLGKVKKLLGDETFMKLASITLGNLDKYLTPPQLTEVLKYERTSRSVRIVKR
jgi:hypothetical protein